MSACVNWVRFGRAGKEKRERVEALKMSDYGKTPQSSVGGSGQACAELCLYLWEQSFGHTHSAKLISPRPPPPPPLVEMIRRSDKLDFLLQPDFSIFAFGLTWLVLIWSNERNSTQPTFKLGSQNYDDVDHQIREKIFKIDRFVYFVV